MCGVWRGRDLNGGVVSHICLLHTYYVITVAVHTTHLYVCRYYIHWLSFDNSYRMIVFLIYDFLD